MAALGICWNNEIINFQHWKSPDTSCNPVLPPSFTFSHASCFTNTLFEGHPVSSYPLKSCVHQEPNSFLNRAEFQNCASYTQLKSVCFIMTYLHSLAPIVFQTVF